MSRNSRAMVLPLRRARSTALARRSLKRPRFGRPVRASNSARWRSCLLGGFLPGDVGVGADQAQRPARGVALDDAAAAVQPEPAAVLMPDPELALRRSASCPVERVA